MIAEDLLERGLSASAEEYDVPDAGLDRLRELLAPSVAEEEKPSWRDWRPSRRTGLMAIAAALVLLVAVPIAIGGNGGGGTTAETAGGAGTPAGPPVAGGANGSTKFSKIPIGSNLQEARKSAAVPTPAPFGAASATAGAPGSATDLANRDSLRGSPIPPVPGQQARIVKTGELDLQVAKGQVSATISRLTTLAGLMRGYVSDSHTTEGSYQPGGEVTMRVPVNAFEQTVSRARGYGKVLALETSGVDVTSKFVDLKARIKALQATRRTFLNILSKATTIGETLAVQDRITQVQTQIEQLQSQVKVLRSQSAMSTLTVTVDQKVAAIAPAKRHHDNGFVKAVKLSVSRFVRGVEAIVGVIGPILLALILIALAWFGAKLGYRTLQRRLV